MCVCCLFYASCVFNLSWAVWQRASARRPSVKSHSIGARGILVFTVSLSKTGTPFWPVLALQVRLLSIIVLLSLVTILVLCSSCVQLKWSPEDLYPKLHVTNVFAPKASCDQCVLCCSALYFVYLILFFS